jgi:amidase
MDAFLQRIEAIDSTLHALVSLRPFDDLRQEAARCDAELDAGRHHGWLHGLPYAVKDLADARGLPTSLGFYEPHERPPASEDETFVDRVRSAGAIIVAKTNTSEFGLGSHTYNQVLPTTVNVSNPTRAAGGSSGGAAVAVAAGLMPVADGSDFMGSLRNPPGWNGVLGMRPSPGVVLERGDDPLMPGFAVDGPIARTAADLAALLGTMSEPGTSVDVQTRSESPPPTIGWLSGFCDHLAFEAGIVDVCLEAVERWSPRVQHTALPTAGAFTGPESLWSTWLTVRHDTMGGWLSEAFTAQEIARMKPEAQWEIEGFARLTDDDRAAAEQCVVGLRTGMAALFEQVDLVMLPTAQVWPFPSEVHWPQEIAGRAMDTYHRWMQVATLATLAGLPTAAVPAGRGASGLHMGLQVVGRPGGDAELLGWLAWAEQRGCFTVDPPTAAFDATG